MLFNSHLFLLLFLPLTLIGYWVLNGCRLQILAMVWLLFCSLVFYAWWKLTYLPLFLCSIIGNYILSKVILRFLASAETANRAKWVLGLGICLNLLLLGYFKYSNFLLSTGSLIFGYTFIPSVLLLPLAVSFFTIQQIVFLVDTYQGLSSGVSLLKYAVYVSFFPHLIAGPIVLHNELIPQLDRIRSKVFDSAIGVRGLLLLSIGLLKKVMIADTLSIWAGQGFDGFGAISFFEAWSASICYSLQLYFDFSGYSDMAVGIALLFNIKLPTNFRSPYQARSIITFWQNWHITLSRFITNYLYVPLLRTYSKIDFNRSMVATLIAMLIAGLWHGADWRFVIFGLMHGIGLVVNHVWRKRKTPMPAALAWLLTFFWVNLAFVFFRASNWSAVWRMLSGMFIPDSLGVPNVQALLMISLTLAIVFFAPNTEKIETQLRRLELRWILISGVVLAIALGALEFEDANEFLYFKF
jgi:D-alanyl-lipoteichoic acid acyltransferase DltB (MBOAT superfamily)